MPWVPGVQGVMALVSAEPERIQEVWIVKSRRPGPARERLREAVVAAGLRFRMVEASALDRAVGDVAHQGVAARVNELPYADEAEVWAPADRQRSLLVVLDRVQDPRNLGSLMRSAAAFGADAVVVPRHRAVGLTPAAMKVAAGAGSVVPVVRVTNLARFVEDAKERGYLVWGTDAEGGVAADEVPWPGRCVLVLGSEGEGVRQKLLEACDGVASLPMVGMESLNVAVAGGIFLYAWARAQGRAAEG